MKKLFVLLVLSAAVLAVRAQSADAIIKEHLNALGGIEKIKSVRSQKITGTFQQGGMNIPFTMYQKRPRKMKLEVTFQGMKQEIAYNDDMGWMINPFQGRTTPEKMTADMEKQQKFQADIDGALVDYASKGYKVEYVGEEDMDGSPTLHLRLTTAEGDVHDYYLDKEAYLVVKEKLHIKNEDGSTDDSEANYSDYKEVNGILYPHSIENVSEYQGQKYSSFLKIDTIENNAEVDDAIFVMPEVK